MEGIIFSGINDVLIISTLHDLPHFEKLLGDGSQIKCKFSYKEQLIKIAKPLHKNGYGEYLIGLV